MIKTATLSNCLQYRYELSRIWDDTKHIVVFIMLNPSTADANNDDPTVKRCVSFAKSWGCGGITIINLFAYRATTPDDMKQARDPIGIRNDLLILTVISRETTGIVICAWGNHGTYLARDTHVLNILERCGIPLFCLHINKGSGQPGHPLYLKKDLKPVLFTTDNKVIT